jgi:hypothetical protein
MSSMGKSLYWISYYKELNKGDLRLYGDVEQNMVNFCMLYMIFDKMNLKECKQLAYAFLRSKEEKIENFDTPFFYLALSVENYLGKVAARDFYKRYDTRFPEGQHISFVRNKLK